jgi:uncharacterized membrane protein
MSDQTKTVTLKGGESQTLTFTVTPTTAGSYTVEFGGLTGEFTVKELESEGTVAEAPVPPEITLAKPACSSFCIV